MRAVCVRTVCVQWTAAHLFLLVVHQHAGGHLGDEDQQQAGEVLRRIGCHMVYSTHTHTHTHHAMVLRALHTHKQLEISNTNAT